MKYTLESLAAERFDLVNKLTDNKVKQQAAAEGHLPLEATLLLSCQQITMERRQVFVTPRHEAAEAEVKELRAIYYQWN